MGTRSTLAIILTTIVSIATFNTDASAQSRAERIFNFAFNGSGYSDYYGGRQSYTHRHDGLGYHTHYVRPRHYRPRDHRAKRLQRWQRQQQQWKRERARNQRYKQNRRLYTGSVRPIKPIKPTTLPTIRPNFYQEEQFAQGYTNPNLKAPSIAEPQVIEPLDLGELGPQQIRFTPQNQPTSIGKLKAVVDLSDQNMKVFVDGIHEMTFPISSGRKGFETPTGSYKPYRTHLMWHSRKYDNAPMPHSVFFKGGYAIHGTSYESKLGRPASHGCVRLSKEDAALFYAMVKDAGNDDTDIVVKR